VQLARCSGNTLWPVGSINNLPEAAQHHVTSTLVTCSLLPSAHEHLHLETYVVATIMGW
jgi:hypothetical protein